MSATILVAEDNPQSLDLMCYVLERAGHSTLRATNGAEAIEAARASRPDLILMDVQMPVMDGYEAAMTFKREPVFRRIPLVAVTAFAMVGDKERVLAAGYDGYITKPILPESFVQQADVFLPVELRSSWSSDPDSAPRQAKEPPASPARVEKSSFAATGSQVKVLVVDDQPLDREFIRTTLESLDCDVASVSSLDDAFEIIRADTPHLIITDLNLHSGSGHDLVRRVKSDPAISHIPIIVLSASSREKSDSEVALSLGAERFIRRPISPEDFLTEIRSVLEIAKERVSWPAS